MNTCQTCHWWSAADEKQKHGHTYRLCIWHVGARGTKVEKIRTALASVILTADDFGCNQWMKDERTKETVEGKPRRQSGRRAGKDAPNEHDPGPI